MRIFRPRDRLWHQQLCRVGDVCTQQALGKPGLGAQGNRSPFTAPFSGIFAIWGPRKLLGPLLTCPPHTAGLCASITSLSSGERAACDQGHGCTSVMSARCGHGQDQDLEHLLGTWRAALLPNSGLRPHTGPPLVLMYVKTGLPQAFPVLTASAPGSLPHRAPHSPWGSGRGGAPGHRSYPAGRVCKNPSLHYLQETLSCLQTTFSSIKGCLEVSRGLSAWRRLSQRKLPCPLAGADP